jgi:hypothetical protein
MTVSELIEELEKFPKDTDVLFDDRNSVLRSVCGVWFSRCRRVAILDETLTTSELAEIGEYAD